MMTRTSAPRRLARTSAAAIGAEVKESAWTPSPAQSARGMKQTAAIWSSAAGGGGGEGQSGGQGERTG